MNYAKETYEAYRRNVLDRSRAPSISIPVWEELTVDDQRAWQVGAAWIVGLFAGHGVHEHRLHAAVRQLEVANQTLVAACRLWDEGFTEGEQFTAEQFRRWVNTNRRTAREAIASCPPLTGDRP